MSKVTVRVVAEQEGLESLSGIWDSLLQRSSDDNAIYLTYDWVTIWWKHFGDGNRLNILLIEKEEEVIGIFPLMITEYKVGFLKFCALETIGSVNCNYIGLVPCENREEVVTALITYLEKELRMGKLVLRLTLVPEYSELLRMLREHASLFSKNLVVQENAKTLAPYISLPATWEEQFSSLSRNRRWLLRKELRKLNEAYKVEFRECAADNLESMLNMFFDLHQRRWQSVNVRGVFSNPRMKEFYRDIARQFHQNSWLCFSYLTVDSEVVSAEFGFVYNGKLYGATAARDLRYSKYSIGHLHYMFMIKDAIKKHLREFDFLKGDEPYKFYWTKSARRYMELLIISRGICPGLRLKFIRALLRLHEVKKYSLKEIYSLYLMKRREGKEKRKMGLKIQYS